MCKLLIQDDILPGLDVYVEYTFDAEDNSVVLYDYGLELTNSTKVGNREIGSPVYLSLRGYVETRWMPDKLVDYIIEEHNA